MWNARALQRILNTWRAIVAPTSTDFGKLRNDGGSGFEVDKDDGKYRYSIFTMLFTDSLKKIRYQLESSSDASADTDRSFVERSKPRLILDISGNWIEEPQGGGGQNIDEDNFQISYMVPATTARLIGVVDLANKRGQLYFKTTHPLEFKIEILILIRFSSFQF